MPAVSQEWVDRVEDYLVPHVEARATGRSMNPDQYRAAAIERMRALLADCQLRSRISHEGLKRLLREGRRTTTFDAPGAPTKWDHDRAFCESTFFDTYSADGAVTRPRPSYGYFFDRDEPPGEEVRPEVSVKLSYYGNAVLVLNDDAWAESTLTFGDSMVVTSNATIPAASPTDALDPDYVANSYEVVDVLDLRAAKENHDGGGRWEYVEAQVHLEVTPGMIDRIVFLLGVGPDDELRALLDLHAVVWEEG